MLAYAAFVAAVQPAGGLCAHMGKPDALLAAEGQLVGVSNHRDHAGKAGRDSRAKGGDRGQFLQQSVFGPCGPLPGPRLPDCLGRLHVLAVRRRTAALRAPRAVRRLCLPEPTPDGQLAATVDPVRRPAWTDALGAGGVYDRGVAFPASDAQEGRAARRGPN